MGGFRATGLQARFALVLFRRKGGQVVPAKWQILLGVLKSNKF